MMKSIRSSARISENYRRSMLRQGIARGEKAAAEGRVASHARARKRMARWLKSPRQSVLRRG